MLASLAFAAEGRFLLAGLFAGLAAFTYSTGVLVVVALALSALTEPGSGWRRLRGAGAACGLAVLGWGAALAYQHRAVAWNAFARMQREYFGNALHDPAATFAVNTRHVWAQEFRPEYLIHAQTLLVALLIGACCLLAWLDRARFTRLDGLLLANGLVFWIVPQVVGPGVSIYRSEALLVGIVPLLRRAPLQALVLLLVAQVGLGFGMAVLFFESVLV
jgi:hypothetical protein